MSKKSHRKRDHNLWLPEVRGWVLNPPANAGATEDEVLIPG